MCRRSVRVAGYRIVSKCFYAFLFRRPRGEKYRTAMLHSLSRSPTMLKLIVILYIRPLLIAERLSARQLIPRRISEIAIYTTVRTYVRVSISMAIWIWRATRKRTHHVCRCIHEISHTSPNAKLHGVLSPMKKSKTCSYFDGEVTDGKACIRVFGFDAGVRKKLAFFQEAKDAVMISNCEVKNSRKGKELEVLVSKNTELCKSEKQFDIDISNNVVSKTVSSNIVLGKLKETPAFQRVNVVVKAIRLEDIEEVPGGKKVQNIIVADSTGTVRFTVWEDRS